MSSTSFAEVVPILKILQETLLYKIFLSHLSPASLICLGHTCVTAHTAVNKLNCHAFDIQKHFKNFFVNPIEFQSLQSHTGTIVSGSNALQFFDRTCYIGSDMDIYVHPGHALEVGLWLIKEEGYTFLPSRSQHGQTFENLVKKDDINCTVPRSYKEHKGPPNDRDHFKEYRFDGIDGVYNFVKIIGGNALVIQVMLTKYNSLDVILHFHFSEYLICLNNNNINIYYSCCNECHCIQCSILAISLYHI